MSIENKVIKDDNPCTNVILILIYDIFAENLMDVLEWVRVIKVGIIASDYIIFDDHRSLLCVMYGCNEERMDQYDMMIVLEHGLMAFELAIEIEEIINYLDINR